MLSTIPVLTRGHRVTDPDSDLSLSVAHYARLINAIGDLNLTPEERAYLRGKLHGDAERFYFASPNLFAETALRLPNLRAALATR